MKQGNFKVNGAEYFSVPSTDFEISPLTANAKLYQDRLVNETMTSVEVGDIPSGKYTKVHGAIGGTTFHINTTDEFIVVYNYE